MPATSRAELGFGAWDFFGVWSLVFGVLISVIRPVGPPMVFRVPSGPCPFAPFTRTGLSPKLPSPGFMAKQSVEMPIEKVTLELPDTKTIRLQWPDGYNPEFKTGQFITLYWPDTPNYKRAYSLSSCALDRGFFETTVKRDGKMGTRIVDWAKVGDQMFVLRPTGRFLPVYGPDKHLICVAGGSGVTPFRAFVREAT